MKASDLRDMTWDRVRAHVHGARERIYRLYAEHGPCTTMELAERANENLWNVRPRTCELVQMGLLEVAGRKGTHGVYAAVPLETARARHEAARRPEQMLMGGIAG